MLAAVVPVTVAPVAVSTVAVALAIAAIVGLRGHGNQSRRKGHG